MHALRVKYPNPDIENSMTIQVLETPRKPKKNFIANKVASVFFDFLGRSVTCILKRVSLPGFSLCLSLVFLGFSFVLNAATITVVGGGCTLVDAIRAANADASRGDCSAGSGFDEIILPNSSFFLLTADLPTVPSSLRMKTLSNNSSSIIDGDDEYRPMKVSGATNVFFENITFQNGNLNTITRNGGAGLLIVDSEVTLSNATIRDNSIELGNRTGAGIRAINSTINLENCKFYQNDNSAQETGGSFSYGNNLALEDSSANIDNVSFKSYLARDDDFEYLNYAARIGAGIFMDNSQATVSNSLFTQLLAGNKGMNIHMQNNSMASVSNSTFYNTTDVGESQIYVEDSEIHLNNVTLFSGVASRGIKSISGNVYITNSYLVDYGEINVDFCIAMDSQGAQIPFVLLENSNNLFPVDQSCAGANVNYSSTSLIEELNDNGGFTATARLEPYSTGDLLNPAIHAGDVNSCETTDQRGVVRGSSCDIGAYESNDVADLSVDMSIVTNPPYYLGQVIEYQIAISNLGPADVYGVDVSINETGLNLNRFQTTHNCNGSSCTINSIANGASALIQMFMNVEIAFDASVIVEGNTDFSSDPSTPNNFDDTGNGSTLVSAADLQLTQSLLTAGPYFNGQSLQYSINIKNLGNNTASNVKITHPNLVGLQAVSHGGCSSSTANTCTVFGINSETSKNITFTATVTGETIVNNSFVSADTYDPVSSNNSATNNNNTATDSDIGVTMSLLTPAPYNSSQYVQYSLSIQNSGPDPATNVVLESLGENVLITDGDNTCAILPCNIAVINNGATVNVTLGGFISVGPGTFKHAVSVLSDQNDLNLSNNASSLTSTINPSSDMSITVNLIDSAPYYVGDFVDFEVKVNNGGPVAATQIDVAFLTIANLEIFSINSTNCSTVPCTIGSQEVGLNNQEIINVSAQISNAGTFRLTSNVSADEYDDVTVNNSHSASAIAIVNPNDLIFANGF